MTDSERLGLTACENNGVRKKINIAEGSEVLHRYNWLAHGLIESSLDNGFILGFEKLEPEDREAYTELQNSLLGRYTSQNAAYVGEHKRRNWLIDQRLNDSQPLTLTHAVEYKSRSETSIFNVYSKGDGTFHKESSQIDRTLSNSLRALNENFLPNLQSRVASGDYTHIVFISMGWNNDQGVSICRMNSLMEQTASVLKEDFNPLVVGITWPSVVFGEAKLQTVKWAGHLGSVFNKANDGDEMGVFFGNIILNRLIPQANVNNLPVVVVGHSYGARIVGRATYSPELLKEGAIGNGPDLLALLQPAFSARRFVAGVPAVGWLDRIRSKINNGLEGAPFAHIEGIKTVTVGTTSNKDIANPVAVWSAHFGGFLGKRYVQKNKLAQKVYDFVEKMSLDKAIESTESAVVGRPMMVDAGKFVGSHNDIYGPNMGKFLAGLISQHAPART